MNELFVPLICALSKAKGMNINMKNIIKFVSFLIYTILIFFTNSYKYLLLYSFINVTIMIFAKIKFIKALINLLNISVFILFTAFINYFTSGIYQALEVAWKLFIVCNITYTFSNILSPVEIAYTIEKLLYPLKIFKIKPKDISLIICIAIAFIPILTNEINQTIYALKSKGVKLKLNNLNLVFKPICVSILQRTNEIELSLNAKSYIG